MLLKIKPKKMSIYVAKGKYTCAQVRQKTGCDICINGTLFEWGTYRAVCDVKADGVVLSDDQYGYWGFGWNNDQPRATMSSQMSKWENYISCVALLRNGKKEEMYYGSDVGGKRGRTAIGYTEDGTLVVYCYKDGSAGACTPEQLATKMLSYGCVDALCLDGGGSVQIDCDFGKITSTRKVANYICIWIDKEATANSADATQETCPYKEPTTNVKYGARGTNAKWVQWQLNHRGYDCGIVDGIFGKNSVAALKAFQKAMWPNDEGQWDGICGKLTRQKLKEE